MPTGRNIASWTRGLRSSSLGTTKCDRAYFSLHRRAVYDRRVSRRESADLPRSLGIPPLCLPIRVRFETSEYSAAPGVQATEERPLPGLKLCPYRESDGGQRRQSHAAVERARRVVSLLRNPQRTHARRRHPGLRPIDCPGGQGHLRATRRTNPPSGTGTVASGSKSAPLFTHHVPDSTSERRSVAYECGALA
jgi:hypothetical protein